MNPCIAGLLFNEDAEDGVAELRSMRAVVSEGDVAGEELLRSLAPDLATLGVALGEAWTGPYIELIQGSTQAAALEYHNRRARHFLTIRFSGRGRWFAVEVAAEESESPNDCVNAGSDGDPDSSSKCSICLDDVDCGLGSLIHRLRELDFGYIPYPQLQTPVDDGASLYDRFFSL